MMEQITYEYWCVLGGLGGPNGHRMMSKPIYNGKHFMFNTYWFRN